MTMKPFPTTMHFAACCLCMAAALTVDCQAERQPLEQASPPPPNPQALYEAARMDRLKLVFTTGEFTYQAYNKPLPDPIPLKIQFPIGQLGLSATELAQDPLSGRLLKLTTIRPTPFKIQFPFSPRPKIGFWP
jgi:hypothetical protein